MLAGYGEGVKAACGGRVNGQSVIAAEAAIQGAGWIRSDECVTESFTA